MLTVVIGFTSALVYGSADFLGGLASRHLGAVIASAISETAGLLLYVILAFLWPGTFSLAAAGWGALAGVFGAAAVGLLYACLAIGPMSVLSPLAALVSAAVPVIWSTLAGHRLGAPGWVGVGVGALAIVLITLTKEERATRPSGAGLLMAVGAGVTIGAFLIAIDSAPAHSGIWPMIVQRNVTGSIMAAIAVGLAIRRAAARHDGARQPRRPGATWRVGLRLALLCGAVDATANAGLLLGLRIGDLAVMAVLTALYPIGTVILARLVLGEELTAVQISGLGLALAGSALLALA